MDKGAWWSTVHGVAKRIGRNLSTKQQNIILGKVKERHSGLLDGGGKLWEGEGIKCMVNNGCLVNTDNSQVKRIVSS